MSVIDILIFVAIAAAGYWLVSAVLGRLQTGGRSQTGRPPLDLPQKPVDSAGRAPREIPPQDAAEPGYPSIHDAGDRCPNPACRQINVVPGSKYCARCGTRLK
jgi:hypothetical protein